MFFPIWVLIAFKFDQNSAHNMNPYHQNNYYAHKNFYLLQYNCSNSTQTKQVEENNAIPPTPSDPAPSPT